MNVQGADNTTIRGNRIGTNAAGTAALPNNFGIDVVNSDNATIAGNLISGNNGLGVFVNNLVTGAVVQGNVIGLAADGVTPLGNGSDGVRLNTTSTTDNLFGGTTPGAGNVIAHNGDAGIWNLGLRNRFLGNSIHSNGGIGIDNNGGGVTPNDAADADTGSGNDGQNFPVLTFAGRVGPNVSVQGTLNSRPRRPTGSSSSRTTSATRPSTARGRLSSASWTSPRTGRETPRSPRS
ncbi:MAG: hypothetical protein ABR576_10380 [Thermoanaerobaculia bacterium]